ncbi:hypothetical protein RCCGEPOP_31576 [Rhizobium sp. Pop5]|nr:hypothetical protein RCCGEPOP_31576 [Rhizobium sp. Pop5]
MHPKVFALALEEEYGREGRVTKRINIICLIAFFLCLLGAFALRGQDIHQPLPIIISIAMLALFPFSVASYMLTRSWREVQKNGPHREFILADPVLSFFIWREERKSEAISGDQPPIEARSKECAGNPDQDSAAAVSLTQHK